MLQKMRQRGEIVLGGMFDSEFENLVDFDDCDALDLFAGTGAVSFELLSRECRTVRGNGALCAWSPARSAAEGKIIGITLRM